MKTRRPLSAVLGAVLAAAGLVSCSGGSDPAVAAADTGSTTSTVATDATTDTGITGAAGYSADHPELATLPVENLSVDEADALLFMREEEKLAHDVYVTLGGLWGIRVFENISRSETSHMDAVLELLDRYSLEDPALAAGVFTNPDLQTLYDALIELGSQTLDDALQVGAAIEDLDIVDLQVRITQTDNADIQLVFSNLLKGSENHLRAFSRQLDRNGVAYQPQYLTQEEYEGIISTAGGRNALGPLPTSS